MKIIIPGTPIAKDRPRHLCTKERRPFVFDVQKPVMKQVSAQIAKQLSQMTESEKREIALKASEISSRVSFYVSLAFIFTPPRSLNIGARNALLWGFGQYNQKPDLDNLEKFYLDCATQAGLWSDDAQVVSLNSKKIYGENARTEMTIVAKKDFTIRNMHMKALSIFSPSELDQMVGDAHYISTCMSFSNEPFVEGYPFGIKENVAMALVAFCNKYADRLMKIKKIAAKDSDENS